MTDTTTPRRLQPYVGCLGYNDSPDEMGEPGGFWHFTDQTAMWTSFSRSEGLNDAFETLGAPTYSAILIGTDANQYVTFHVLVISTQPIRPREADILAQTQAWLDRRLDDETPVD